MKTNAIRIEEYGGPEVLNYEEVDLNDLQSGEARICHSAIGLNFIDTYHRSGLYPMPLPTGLGSEAAGVVEAVAEDVTAVKVGDRVVYTGRPTDSYSDRRNFDADQLVPIPSGIEDDQAAALFLKGLTAWYLLRKSYKVQPGDNILLHAAAGGVGLIACQWASYLGANIIGVVSTEEKAELAKSHGCGQIIMADDNVAEKVLIHTDGEGVAAVYDSIGRDTFFASLNSLRPHGVMVTFGNASGPVDPFPPSELASRHSLYVTRPILADFVNTREKLLNASQELFDLVIKGVIKININQRYALKDAAQAHIDLESRKTTGSTILIP
ncbi:MAG: quinone oxidoreductase [Pseudomonadota bacterium]|nr:quinone oxidoreductase [Pseudomonadota bacterium]